MSSVFSFSRGRVIVPPVVVEQKYIVLPAMALDTGARITLITPRLAEEAGIDLPAEGPKIEIIGVSGPSWAQPISIGSISWLGMSVRNVQALCHPLSSRLGLDGILGLNFLQHFNLVIDHDTETIRVTLSAGSAP